MVCEVVVVVIVFLCLGFLLVVFVYCRLWSGKSYVVAGEMLYK